MPSQPNILLITTDQQRWDTVHPHKPAWMRTPHFDDIRRQGIQFNRAYTDTPICVASRVSIMTGKSSFRHGVRWNVNTDEHMGHTETLPALLRDLGYTTAAIGKMHFGPERNRHGFEEMILPADYYNEMARSGNPLQPMRHGMGQNELYPALATVPEALTLTNWTADKCADYILERRDPTRPFFLWCSFTKPHPPLDPPEPYYSMYRDCEIPGPVHGDWAAHDQAPAQFLRNQLMWSHDQIPPEIYREARAAYLGLITQCDYNMGRVFAALQDLNIFNDTLILYCSDHGEYLGDHGAGCKVFFHEASAHVPFVLRLPKSWGLDHAGETSDDPVLLADILPTLITAAGGTPPQDCDGQSLLPKFKDKRRTKLIAQGGSDEKPDLFMLLQGDHKLIYWVEGAHSQLFNLKEDPKELKNLAPSMPEKVKEMQSTLLQELKAADSPHQSLPKREIQKDEIQKLRAQFWAGYHTENYGIDVKH